MASKIVELHETTMRAFVSAITVREALAEAHGGVVTPLLFEVDHQLVEHAQIQELQAFAFNRHHPEPSCEQIPVV